MTSTLNYIKQHFFLSKWNKNWRIYVVVIFIYLFKAKVASSLVDCTAIWLWPLFLQFDSPYKQRNAGICNRHGKSQNCVRIFPLLRLCLHYTALRELKPVRQTCLSSKKSTVLQIEIVGIKPQIPLRYSNISKWRAVSPGGFCTSLQPKAGEAGAYIPLLVIVIKTTIM